MSALVRPPGVGELHADRVRATTPRASSKQVCLPTRAIYSADEPDRSKATEQPAQMTVRPSHTTSRTQV